MRLIRGRIGMPKSAAFLERPESGRYAYRTELRAITKLSQRLGSGTARLTTPR